MSEPTVGDLLNNPEVIARLAAIHDRAGLENPYAADERKYLFLYYCVRCHRSHQTWSAIGKRHDVPQPMLIRLKGRAG